VLKLGEARQAGHSLCRTTLVPSKNNIDGLSRPISCLMSVSHIINTSGVSLTAAPAGLKCEGKAPHKCKGGNLFFLYRKRGDTALFIGKPEDECYEEVYCGPMVLNFWGRKAVARNSIEDGGRLSL